MIRGIGLDLCEIGRIGKAMENERFLVRFFTQEERDYIISRGKCGAQSAAGTFAAKEAAGKALGCGIVFPLTDISVLHDGQGAPHIRLEGKARERFEADGGGSLYLSITHTDTTAAAVVIWEEPNVPRN